MRGIHGDLSTAQKAANRTPYLRTLATDKLAGINRLRRTSWYAGAEADEAHAAIAWTHSGTNYLLRARMDGTTLYRSRVTNPVSGSTYSSWTQWASPVQAGPIAFAKAGSTIWFFEVANADDTKVYARKSVDNGASWTGPVLQFTHSVAVTHMAAAGKSDGNVVVILNAAASGLSKITAMRYTGSWTDHGDTATALVTLTGLAIFYGPDWNVILTGVGTAHYVVGRYLFGDNFSQAINTWSGALWLQSATVASNIEYHHPSIARPDTNRVTFRQRYTGTVAYDRIAHTQQPGTGAFVDDIWREPVPTAISAPYGLAISYDDDNVFFTTARYVYQSPNTAALLDLSADVVSAHLHDAPLNPVLSHIDLNNASGKYDTPGAGAVAALTKGADIEVSPGYLTTSGNWWSPGPTYHVQAFEHTYEKGRATLRLILGSPWTHLARHRFPRAVTFDESDRNIFQQLRYIAARVGYEFSSVGGSSDSADLYPPLAIMPGTSALATFRAVLQRIPDHMVTFGVSLMLSEPLAAAASVADYKRPLSDGDQNIDSATYRDALKVSNHMQVFADDDAEIIAEDLDDAEAQQLYSAPRQRADTFLDTGAEATARAAREQREQTILTTRGGRITAPVHCGLQTNDVLAITDTRAGLTDAKRRVLSLILRYDRGPRKAHYDQVIELGAP